MASQTMTQGNEVSRTRSRRSMVKEGELHQAAKRVDIAIAVTTRRIGELEQQIARTTKLVIHEDNSTARYNLGEMLKDVAGQRDFVRACESDRASTQAEILKLTLGPVECKVRLGRQEQVASLVGARLEKDREADRLIGDLKRVLGERAALTRKIGEQCEALDLEISPDGLDEARFENLLASLPEGVLTGSERWHGWFVGKRKDVKPYVVRAHRLMATETLFHNGVYSFGDSIYLSEQEASDLLCEEYAGTHPEARWRCAPPLVMTVEAYQMAVETALEKGISPQEVCFWKDVERDARDKEWFRNNGSPRARRPFPAVLKQNVPYPGVATIGLLYKGQPMQVSTYKDAWSMVDEGAVRPF